MRLPQTHSCYMRTLSVETCWIRFSTLRDLFFTRDILSCILIELLYFAIILLFRVKKNSSRVHRSCRAAMIVKTYFALQFRLNSRNLTEATHSKFCNSLRLLITVECMRNMECGTYV